MIISIARAVSDLERVGDEAKKIATTMLRGDGKRSSRPSPQLARDARHMSHLALQMLRDALDTFDRTDAAAAVEVVRRDQELNAEFQAALRRLLTQVMEDPRRVPAMLDAVDVLKSLERVGDHAKNIARYVLYVVEGRDVRHEDTAVLLADGARSAADR